MGSQQKWRSRRPDVADTCFCLAATQAEVVHAGESSSPRGGSIRRVNSSANLGEAGSDALGSKGKSSMGPEDGAVIDVMCKGCTACAGMGLGSAD